MTLIASRLLAILGLAVALSATGCVYRNGVSTCRIWADYNTLMTPALYVEETDHLPYHAARIEHYHWMYNAHTVAQRQGGLYPVGRVAPRQSAPHQHEPAVPLPSDLLQEDSGAPDESLPPLPTTLPQQLKSLDDGPVPSIPIPITPESEWEEIEGPTAWGDSPFGTGRQ